MVCPTEPHTLPAQPRSRPVTTAEAVEAAVRIIHPDWEVTGEEWWKDAVRERLRTALEAAAPYMLTTAWDQGELAGSAKKVLEDEYPHLGLTANPYRKDAS